MFKNNWIASAIIFLSLFLAVPQNIFATCSVNGVLLLHGDGTNGSTTFTDSSDSGHTMTANGNAQLDTSQQKFGTASMLFDGTGDFLTTPSNSDFSFGTGDFTIELFVRFNAHTSNAALFLMYTGGNETGLYYETSNIIRFRVLGGTTDVTGSFTPTNGVWYHIMGTRSGTTMRLGVDGTSLGTATDSTNLSNTSTNYIASTSGGNNQLNGWIDELHIVKGTALYTGNYTVPTAAYGCVTTTTRMCTTGVGA